MIGGVLNLSRKLASATSVEELDAMRDGFVARGVTLTEEDRAAMAVRRAELARADLRRNARRAK